MEPPVDINAYYQKIGVLTDWRNQVKDARNITIIEQETLLTQITTLIETIDDLIDNHQPQ